jgi:hypothetical protein
LAAQLLPAERHFKANEPANFTKFTRVVGFFVKLSGRGADLT